MKFIILALFIYVIVSLPKNLIVRAILGGLVLWFYFGFVAPEGEGVQPWTNPAIIAGAVIAVLYPSRKALGAMGKDS